MKLKNQEKGVIISESDLRGIIRMALLNSSKKGLLSESLKKKFAQEVWERVFRSIDDVKIPTKKGAIALSVLKTIVLPHSSAVKGAHTLIGKAAMREGADALDSSGFVKRMLGINGDNIYYYADYVKKGEVSFSDWLSIKPGPAAGFEASLGDAYQAMKKSGTGKVVYKKSGAIVDEIDAAVPPGSTIEVFLEINVAGDSHLIPIGQGWNPPGTATNQIELLDGATSSINRALSNQGISGGPGGIRIKPKGGEAHLTIDDFARATPRDKGAYFWVSKVGWLGFEAGISAFLYGDWWVTEWIESIGRLAYTAGSVSEALSTRYFDQAWQQQATLYSRWSGAGDNEYYPVSMGGRYWGMEKKGLDGEVTFQILDSANWEKLKNAMLAISYFGSLNTQLLQYGSGGSTITAEDLAGAYNPRPQTLAGTNQTYDPGEGEAAHIRLASQAIAEISMLPGVTKTDISFAFQQAQQEGKIDNEAVVGFQELMGVRNFRFFDIPGGVIDAAAGVLAVDLSPRDKPTVTIQQSQNENVLREAIRRILKESKEAVVEKIKQDLAAIIDAEDGIKSFEENYPGLKAGHVWEIDALSGNFNNGFSVEDVEDFTEKAAPLIKNPVAETVAAGVEYGKEMPQDEDIIVGGAGAAGGASQIVDTDDITSNLQVVNTDQPGTLLQYTVAAWGVDEADAREYLGNNEATAAIQSSTARRRLTDQFYDMSLSDALSDGVTLQDIQNEINEDGSFELDRDTSYRILFKILLLTGPTFYKENLDPLTSINQASFNSIIGASS